MGRNRKDISATSKVAGSLSFAAIGTAVPRKAVEEEIAKAGRKERRVRALPASVVVYYTMAMCIYWHTGVEEVLRWVLEEARKLFGAEEVKVASSGAISSARKRLGGGVLEALYRRLAQPLARKETAGAWHRGLLPVALDGSTLDLQDTAANAGRFGRPGASRGEAAFPQLRFVTLVEAGTHVLFGARMGACGESEQALAAEVVASSLREGMLCMADRLFYGYGFWAAARGTGAHLLWRVKSNLRLPVEERLADGSYLSTVYADEKGRRRGLGGQRVRVVEYRLKGGGAPPETYRLMTTLLDHAEHPAVELARLYPRRWEVETTYDEFKTHLRGGRVVLRSKTPELVRQEFYAFLLTHYCLRRMMHEAALANGVPPLRLSFTHAVQTLRRKLPAYQAGFSPSGRTAPPQGDRP